jgi:uncharacterized protein (UPF0332 family)
MPILNPDHLFEQAERLAASRTAGAPRQVDLRRAISAAYYGLFHAVLALAADQFLGTAPAIRKSRRYALVYRSVDHAAIRSLCVEVAKSTPTMKYKPHVPQGGFGPSLTAFAIAFQELQEARHKSDYDPLYRLKASDARSAVSTARSALRRLKKAPAPKREMFLTLLLFSPR